jgi:tripartite-type tricarboxylate transporter receptor subunit TctC
MRIPMSFPPPVFKRDRRTVLVTSGALAAGAAVPLLATLAHAQEAYPSRPIHFIVPLPPGSGSDTSARYFANKIGELAKVPVVVENKPGANGLIAVQAVLGAKPDGYTVLIGSNSPLATNAALYKKLSYDPVADFSAVSIMMRAPILLIVPANSPYKTVAELIEGAKKQPGKLNYGAGTPAYRLFSERFNEMAGTKLMNVPYKGSSEVIAAVVSGTVDLGIVDITGSLELARGGKVRALAVTSEQRAAQLPDVPTTREAGLPGYTPSVWVAAAVSSKTPATSARKLEEWFVTVAKMPETREFFSKLNAEVATGGAKEMRDFQLQEVETWKRIVTTAKIEQL